MFGNNQHIITECCCFRRRKVTNVVTNVDTVENVTDSLVNKLTLTVVNQSTLDGKNVICGKDAPLPDNNNPSLYINT